MVAEVLAAFARSREENQSSKAGTGLGVLSEGKEASAEPTAKAVMHKIDFATMK